MKTLKDLANRWQYTADKSEQWVIPKVEADGAVRDDCDGYALAALYILSGHSMWKFWYNLIFKDAKICYVTNNGGGHAVLRFNGQYIDNWSKELTTKEAMESFGHNFEKRGFYFWQVAIRLAFTKVFGKTI